MSNSSPRVGIVMGSDSDWPKINAAKKALDEFGVACEVRVMSAHRTPEVVTEYATTAANRLAAIGIGFEVIHGGGRVVGDHQQIEVSDCLTAPSIAARPLHLLDSQY